MTTSTLHPRLLRLVLATPTEPASGWVIRHAEVTRAIECARTPRRASAVWRGLLCRRPLLKHRIADDVADGVDVTHWCASGCHFRDEAARVDRDTGACRRRSCARSNYVREACRIKSYHRCGHPGLLSPLETHPQAVVLASTAVVFVFKHDPVRRCVPFLSQTFYQSRSGPASRPSSISTTSTFASQACKR